MIREYNECKSITEIHKKYGVSYYHARKVVILERKGISYEDYRRMAENPHRTLIKEHLGTFLQESIKRKGVNLVDLARIIGMSKQRVHQYFGGKAFPRIGDLERVLKAVKATKKAREHFYQYYELPKGK